VSVRSARPEDVAAVAGLHADRIREGFLTSLGAGFLRRLYRRVLVSDDGFVLVASAPTSNAPVIGFVAGVGSVGALYRRFIFRDGLVAGALAAPRLVRAIPRVVETLRYPSVTGDLPDAEILAVAVAADATGAGIGRALVGAANEEFSRRGVMETKVVTSADNASALAMYRACGFVSTTGVEVHAGRASEVLVWTAS
jgi:ribosomal protein S18 acetylase RimI-like enzyme